jgi:hypothetical protein
MFVACSKFLGISAVGSPTCALNGRRLVHLVRNFSVFFCIPVLSLDLPAYQVHHIYPFELERPLAGSPAGCDQKLINNSISILYRWGCGAIEYGYVFQ